MSMTQEMSGVLKQYRILLTSLRTPKVRVRLLELLAEQKETSAQSGVTPAALDKPFRQLRWLDAGYEDSMEEIGQQIQLLNDVLGPQSILFTERIDEWPQDWRERKHLVRAVCERVFAAGPEGRVWLTETEYTARLSMLVTEPITARRYSVDMGIVQRDERGQKYSLA
ncbi:hypothetical protein B9G54_03405 [Alloscardovia macacae]|uniref:DUF2087 domain-containing protein n=1 Tax=Alloscardovia macacae TaxID=1160091 RepID=A0A1Y2T1T0_9BIFI|nr:DUF2087 domain-containing protein [Alloscardovia macacae]OTA26841.1 hypothetical protein B9G54_03405 [Alloscardovia macacae]OTA29135.1 hypothetical protein B9T39_04440 [Alloscardovia macacae]